MRKINFKTEITKRNKTGGITLIALVITIIVLLILAGISISMLSGDNSILQRATFSRESSEKAEAKEQAQIDVMSWITDKKANNEDASLDDNKIKTILTGKSYVKNGQPGNKSFITAKGEYEIYYSELYSSNNEPKYPEISDNPECSDLEYFINLLNNEENDNCEVWIDKKYIGTVSDVIKLLNNENWHYGWEINSNQLEEKIIVFIQTDNSTGDSRIVFSNQQFVDEYGISDNEWYDEDNYQIPEKYSNLLLVINNTEHGILTYPQKGSR